MNAIAPYLSRLIATAVAFGASWLAQRLGIVLDEETQTQITTAGVLVILAVFQTIYVLVHKFVSRFTNPTDAAKGHLSTPEKLVATAHEESRPYPTRP